MTKTRVCIYVERQHAEFLAQRNASAFVRSAIDSHRSGGAL